MERVESRVFEIEKEFGDVIVDIVVFSAHEGYFKLLLYLKDGSTLRVTEDWAGNELAGYSYYWLDARNTLKIGWDNAPHHKKLSTFPHHKHVGSQFEIKMSQEKNLEQILKFIRSRIK